MHIACLLAWVNYRFKKSFNERIFDNLKAIRYLSLAAIYYILEFRKPNVHFVT